MQMSESYQERFRRLLQEAHTSLTVTDEDGVLVIQAGAHRVVLAPWSHLGECEYTVPLLTPPADLLLLLPLRAPLVLRVEEIRAQAQLVIPAISEAALVQILQYLDRFQTQSIAKLRRIFISCALTDLWELSAN